GSPLRIARVPLTIGLRLSAAGVLLALAAWHGARAAWIEAKAELAQALVRRAWQRTLAGARDARPWPWADTRPGARLMAPGPGGGTVRVAGAGGRTRAVGP